MSIYLVDYENVNEIGLEGIHQLNEGDKVFIFYSARIKTIPLERSIELIRSKAKIEFIEIHKIGKNYLDFQLATFLGFLVGKGEKESVYIISKDSGFNSVVDFWKERNINIFQRIAVGEKKQEVKNQVKQEQVNKEQVNKEQVNKEQVNKEQVNKEQANKDLPEQYRKKVREAVKNLKLSPSGYTSIYKAIVECSDKQKLNNAMIKAFNNENGAIIYGTIKNIYEEYIKNRKS